MYLMSPQTSELQALSGRHEGDATLAASVPIKPQPLPAIDTSVAITSNGPLPSDEGRSKKSLLRWKGHRKINQIYGDWLDDLPLGRKLQSELER